MSAIFLISRGLATGVAIYTVALVLAPILQIPFWLVLLVIGLVTLVYDTLGGMRAVVWSDVIQMIVLSMGIIAISWYAWELVGGVGRVGEVLDPSRFSGDRLCRPRVWRRKRLCLLAYGIGRFFSLCGLLWL